MARKSVKREYELDRSYDYADSIGFNNTKRNVGLVKRRARRRLRHDEKKDLSCKLRQLKSFGEESEQDDI